jgi:hypothetical protein
MEANCQEDGYTPIADMRQELLQYELVRIWLKTDFSLMEV